MWFEGREEENTSRKQIIREAGEESRLSSGSLLFMLSKLLKQCRSTGPIPGKLILVANRLWQKWELLVAMTSWITLCVRRLPSAANKHNWWPQCLLFLPPIAPISGWLRLKKPNATSCKKHHSSTLRSVNIVVARYCACFACYQDLTNRRQRPTDLLTLRSISIFIALFNVSVIVIDMTWLWQAEYSQA